MIGRWLTPLSSAGKFRHACRLACFVCKLENLFLGPCFHVLVGKNRIKFSTTYFTDLFFILRPVLASLLQVSFTQNHRGPSGELPSEAEAPEAPDMEDDIVDAARAQELRQEGNEYFKAGRPEMVVVARGFWCGSCWEAFSRFPMLGSIFYLPQPGGRVPLLK